MWREWLMLICYVSFFLIALAWVVTGIKTNDLSMWRDGILVFVVTTCSELKVR